MRETQKLPLLASWWSSLAIAVKMGEKQRMKDSLTLCVTLLSNEYTYKGGSKGEKEEGKKERGQKEGRERRMKGERNQKKSEVPFFLKLLSKMKPNVKKRGWLPGQMH